MDSSKVKLESTSRSRTETSARRDEKNPIVPWSRLRSATIGQPRCASLSCPSEGGDVHSAIAVSAAKRKKHQQGKNIFFGRVPWTGTISFQTTAIWTVKLFAHHGSRPPKPGLKLT